MVRRKGKPFSNKVEDTMLEDIQNSTVVNRDLGEVLVDGYLKYALSVIVGRALPDVRDGLKPSQRRVLFAMLKLGLSPNAKTRKCAKVCGDTSGDYHPHGESIIYPTLVRMAQSWAMRYPLVIGQGNFGSVDGDAPAAMRYTEAKLSHICTKLTDDIDKDTVDMVSNYDETKLEPTIFPSAFPNVLCNGASGIAVGMATNIPPHNIMELFEAVKELIARPYIEDMELLEIVKGPDFPTGGQICGKKGICDLYLKGSGKIVVRGDMEYDEEAHMLRISSIPYGITKSRIITQIAECVGEKIITEISDIRDESDKDGIMISVALKNGADGDAVINQLYKKTDMHVSEGFSLLAINNGRPVKMTLKIMLNCWLEHRRSVIKRRTRYELRQAELRQEVLVAFLKVLSDMNKTVALIRESKDKMEAKLKLQAFFGFSERQALAILDMRLHSITSMERGKVEAEHSAIVQKIALCKEILASPQRIDEIILSTMESVINICKPSELARLSVVMEDEVSDWDIESSISNTHAFVTVSHRGYIKRMSISEFREQKRGGIGVKGFESKNSDDFIMHVHNVKLLDTLLVFTSRGRCFSMKVWKLQEMHRRTLGKHISSLFGESIQENESISAILPIRTFDDNTRSVMFCTEKGIIKQTMLSAFSNVRRTGIVAIKIDEDDKLIAVRVGMENDQVMILSEQGMGIRFDIGNVRTMGRVSRGVKGMSLKPGDKVVSCNVVTEEDSLMLCCSNGYGKRSKVHKFRKTNRGGVGVRAIITNARNGVLVKAVNTATAGSIVVAVSNGNTVIVPVRDMRDIGRSTQGIKVVNIPSSERVVAIGEIEEQDSGV